MSLEGNGWEKQWGQIRDDKGSRTFSKAQGTNIYENKTGSGKTSNTKHRD